MVFEQVEDLRVERLGPIEQHEIDRNRQIGLKRLQRVAFTDFDEIDQAAGDEVFPRPRRLGRLELAGDEAAAASGNAVCKTNVKRITLVMNGDT